MYQRRAGLLHLANIVVPHAVVYRQPWPVAFGCPFPYRYHHGCGKEGNPDAVFSRITGSAEASSGPAPIGIIPQFFTCSMVFSRHSAPKPECGCWRGYRVNTCISKSLRVSGDALNATVYRAWEAGGSHGAFQVAYGSPHFEVDPNAKPRG